MEVRLSRESMNKIAYVVTELNRVYKVASSLFEESVDCVEDIKLLNTLEDGSEE